MKHLKEKYLVVITADTRKRSLLVLGNKMTMSSSICAAFHSNRTLTCSLCKPGQGLSPFY